MQVKEDLTCSFSILPVIISAINIIFTCYLPIFFFQPMKKLKVVGVEDAKNS